MNGPAIELLLVSNTQAFAFVFEGPTFAGWEFELDHRALAVVRPPNSIRAGPIGIGRCTLQLCGGRH
jgi:hypothetical protein